jgi:radical SAM protein with 4Fe4S-binding SPASM domain
LRRHTPGTNRSSDPIPGPGLYHYRKKFDGGEKRIHLRIEDDLHGLLIVNANQILELNPTAILMAYCILEELPEKQALQLLKRRFSVSRVSSKQDYTQFKMDLKRLLIEESCPACSDIDVEVSNPFSARPSAPYRMDLAITYRCNNDCSHCYNARPRTYPEIPTREWKQILDNLFDLRIAHVVFTGGEPTLREDLPDLIRYADNLGMIVGLNTNGRRLQDKKYAAILKEAGLEHIQITVESDSADIHNRMVAGNHAWQQTINGLKNALETSLYVMTNTTMLKDNADTIPETIDFLASLGVPTIGLNALIYSGRGKNVGTGLAEQDLYALLENAQERCDHHGQRLIWYTPTEYCSFDPMQLDLGVKGCTAALYNMCIEPDGGVIPCQSYYQQVGSMLTDSWDSIWNHDLCTQLRERSNIAEKCADCLILADCGGGCPLTVETK